MRFRPLAISPNGDTVANREHRCPYLKRMIDDQRLQRADARKCAITNPAAINAA